MTVLPGATDERYAALCDYAARTAQVLVQFESAGQPSSLARYVLDQSKCLVAAHSDSGRERPSCIAADALDLVVASWPDLFAGDRTGEDVIADHGGLWRDLMASWPMGVYADLVVSSYRQQHVPLGMTIELGAGVGVTTRPLARAVLARGGRLVATDRAYTGARFIDFDSHIIDQLPGSAAAVVATNAIHCAVEPEATIRWIRDCLKPGGLVVLGEGAPFPEPGTPWALNLAFGICVGWYDRGGFRPRWFWIDALRSAGFVDIEMIPLASARYDFGGVFHARAP